MRVSHLPSGNSICMFHIAYQSTIKYLFKFPQHNALFLLSETVFLLITSSKSIFFPAKHHFTFHLIPDKFLPIYLEYNSGCRSQTSRALAFKHTHNFFHRSENQLPDRWEVPAAQAGSTPHTWRGSKGTLLHPRAPQVGKNNPLTWNTNRNSLCSCTKKITFALNNPTCTPQGIPMVCKRHFSKRSMKGQPRNFTNTRHWGRKLKSQEEPSGLPDSYHLGSYSKSLCDCMQPQFWSDKNLAFAVRLLPATSA